ncbi:hypothetical protein ICW40_07140 [Actinotalea ferrariae]|uniref:hypothetical protein n=1 Tax=Actinotalea ferrariae TaxID=1386098 RepID=UPI001C8CC383|nr:hypothetical protein [Actinotalea ferrariae]MBX9244582.1 hypothetical protein [Actinotalea ferrariae]
MSTMLHPVGPRPPQVYWVRRLVVLAVLVGVVAVLWAVLGRGAAPADGASGADTDADASQDAGAGDGDEATTGASDDAADATDAAVDAPQEQAADQGPVVCAPADLTLALTTDARAYAAGVQPTFTVALTNAGGAACTVDADAAQREILITSGSDRIWSSLDCPPTAAPNLLLLEPGARTDAPVVWDRTRSAVGCTGGLPEPRPGTYSAVVTMLGATSAPVVFELG